MDAWQGFQGGKDQPCSIYDGQDFYTEAEDCLCQEEVDYSSKGHSPICHYHYQDGQDMSWWNSKYKLLLIVVTYNLGSIGKMGYKKVNSKWVNIRGAQGDDNDDDASMNAPKEAQVIALLVPDPAVLTATFLDQIMGMWGQQQLSLGQMH